MISIVPANRKAWRARNFWKVAQFRCRCCSPNCEELYRHFGGRRFQSSARRSRSFPAGKLSNMRPRRFLGRLSLVLTLVYTSPGPARAAGPGDDRESRPEAAAGLPLVFQDDFERGNLEGWDFT